MADLDFDEFDGGYHAPNKAVKGRWVHLAGAACSIGLALGVVVWGYKLAVRDVTGIPVVRALEGPLRIAPENPGGDVAMHQGLSVNGVAAVGTAAPLPETVRLAPSVAVLDAEDTAGLAVLASAPARLPAVQAPIAASVNLAAPIGSNLKPVEVVPSALPETAAADTAGDLAVEQPVPETQQDAVAAALAIALADGGETFAEPAPAAIMKSVRPIPRPQRPEGAEVIASDAADPLAVEAPKVTEVDSASIPAGTRLVQLGAFDDAATARDEWIKLQGLFPELVGAKAMVVQPAQSGGRTFYRLRAHGFENEDETRRFCAALLAENASCIAVAQR